MSLVITDEKKYQKAIRAKAFSEVLGIIDKVIEGQMKQAETFRGNGCHSLAKTHQDQACGAQIAKRAVLRLKEAQNEEISRT